MSNAPVTAYIADEYPRSAYAWYVVVVLILINVLSAVDRQLPALLVAPIRRDLAISDTEISLLQGLAFALFYACFGIPLGWLSDRTNRRNIIFIGVLVWSVMTAACGLGNSFVALFAARIGVGLGEAALLPAAYSLIADYFDLHHRGRALSLFTTSQFTGVGISWGVGGLLIMGMQAHPGFVLPILGALPAWKLAFITVGLIGLILAPIVLTIKEPARKERASAAAFRGGAVRLMPYLRKHTRVFVPVYTAYAFMGFVGYNFQSWLPTYFERRYHIPAATAGLRIGLVIAVVGTCGCIVSGLLGDYWTAHGRLGGRFRVTLIWWSVALVSTIAIFFSSNAVLCLIFVGTFNFGAAVSLSSAAATIQDVVPNELRGRSTAMYLLLLGVIGFGFGPSAVALVTDYVFRSDAALTYSLLLVPIPGILIGLSATLSGLRPYDELLQAMHRSRGEYAIP